MKIANLRRYVGRINGGASGRWTKEKCEFHGAVERGRVTFSSLQLSENNYGGSVLQILEPSLTIKVNDKTFKIRAHGVPRINVGEEVIIHHMGEDVEALQIVDGEIVFFRMQAPEKEFRYGSRHYVFEDEELPDTIVLQE